MSRLLLKDCFFAGRPWFGLRIMEYLSDQAHVIAVLAKILRQRYPVTLQQSGLGEIHRFSRCGVTTQEKRYARRVAERKLSVGSLEPYSLAGQPVDIRRLGNRVTVGTDPEVEVIHSDEQHIRASGFCRPRER